MTTAASRAATEKLRVQIEKHNAVLKAAREKRDADILARLAAGETQKVLAREYDLTEGRIRQIRDRAARNGDKDSAWSPFRQEEASSDAAS